MSLTEIKYLLKDAKEILEFISINYQENIGEAEVSIAIRLKVKHFLEDIKSSLDYIGYYIFMKYCKNNVTSKLDDHIRNLYFPNKDTEQKFTKYIDSMYPGLKDSYPDIVLIFKSVQQVNWFTTLNQLVNTNKHRHLSKQRKEHVGTHNHYAEDHFGNVFSNNIMLGQAENAIVVNGHSVGSPSSINDPYFKSYSATFYYDFIFTDLQIPVIETLTKIYDEANSVINKLTNLLEGV